jgi:uncharacterized protein (TIGR00251 family)
MAERVRLNLRVIPNASRAQVIGWMEGHVLKVKVQAPPTDGRANEQVIALMADFLGIKSKQVELILGATARNKTLEFTGIDEREIEDRISRLQTSTAQ